MTFVNYVKLCWAVNIECSTIEQKNEREKDRIQISDKDKAHFNLIIVNSGGGVVDIDGGGFRHINRVAKTGM